MILLFQQSIWLYIGKEKSYNMLKGCVLIGKGHDFLIEIQIQNRSYMHVDKIKQVKVVVLKQEYNLRKQLKYTRNKITIIKKNKCVCVCAESAP